MAGIARLADNLSIGESSIASMNFYLFILKIFTSIVSDCTFVNAHL